jgi:serine/threonine protein kinase
LSEGVEKGPGEELMSPERWNRLETVFDAALAVRQGAREQFLNQACEGDARLRREVESLLSADSVSNDLLQDGAAELCMKVMAETLKDDSDQQRPSQDGISPGLVLKGRWEILAAMEEGGMGQVYKARDLTLDRLAVVKVLKKDSQRNPWIVKKFGDEAKAQSRIEHENVAILFDKGSMSSGEQYLVMEFIKGKTLRQLMNDHKLNGDQIDLSLIADIMRQAGRGVAAIHEAGLVHRDLKPENIMIQKKGDDLKVKIIDFGIVRVLDKSTVVGQLVGTVFYMAPEQLRGEDAKTTGSDVYALAVIAYELLTGRRPFEIGNASSTQAAVRYLLDLQAKGMKLKPTELRDGLLPETNRLIMKGLSLDAKKRPSARQFTEELARLLNLVPPPRPAPSLRGWLVAAGIVLAVVLGFTAWGLSGKSNQSAGSGPSSIVDLSSERKLTYWLTILRKRDGKTIRVSGREAYDTGDEFKLHFIPSETGALYVFNEGTSKNWHVLFPTPENNNGDSRLAPLKEFVTRENVFTHPKETEKGTERIWIVWAAQPIQSLDDIVRKSFSNELRVTDSSQLSTLSAFLKDVTTNPEVSYPKESEVALKSKSEILVYSLGLEHLDWK